MCADGLFAEKSAQKETSRMTGNTYYSTAFPAGQEFYAEKMARNAIFTLFFTVAPPSSGKAPLPQIAPWIIVQVSRRHPGMPPYAKPIVGSDS